MRPGRLVDTRCELIGFSLRLPGPSALLLGAGILCLTLPAGTAAGQTGTPQAGTPPAGTPQAGTPQAGTPQAGTPQSGVPVQVAPAIVQDVPVFVSGIGTVQAFQSVLIRARVDGTLDRVLFTEGQAVKPGDLLAVIDPRPYQAALSQALAKKAADEAQLANYRRDLTRYSDLARSDFASRQSVDTQSAQVLQGQANVQGDDAAIATAQLNLGFTQITSPIDGRVGLRQIDPGNLIHANDATGIVTITQVHPISVLFTLPQDALPQVQAAMHRSAEDGAAKDGKAGGHPIVLAYSADDRTELSGGELLTPDNTIDTSTGTIRLKAVFANADDKLWPGQYVNVRLLLRTEPKALTVPSEAVQRGPEGLYVFLLGTDGTVSIHPVRTGQDDGHVAVIADGLQAGQQVVVAGQSRLSNGTRVAVAAPAASAGKSGS